MAARGQNPGIRNTPDGSFLDVWRRFCPGLTYLTASNLQMRLNPTMRYRNQSRRLNKDIACIAGWVARVALLVVLLVLARPAQPASAANAVLSIASSSTTLSVGTSAVVTINVAAVSNLYGYQFQVSYDPGKVNATGAFINSFLDTSTNAFIPSSWNAACSAGVCRFALSKVNPATSVSGTGPLAQITFVGIAAGDFAVGFSGDLLTDRNGMAIAHTATGGSVHVSTSPATLELTIAPASTTLSVGTSAVVTINLAGVSNLYGYQFKVSYDASKVSATGVFINTFVDSTTNAFIPPGWNAACSAGVCRFAVTKLRPAAPVSGTGTLAQITFTGIAPGVFPAAFSDDSLSDPNGMAIAHTSAGGTVTVYGAATINGTVSLQGRGTPITPGTVTLQDNAFKFAPVIVNFDQTTGDFSATVSVDAGGSSVYNLLAGHSLYLSSKLGDPGLNTGITVSNGGTFSAGSTRLNGGDANNDGSVDILDLACVGNGYDTAGRVCGTTGSSDLNADGTVNIFDLVLVGSNYDLDSPQPW